MLKLGLSHPVRTVFRLMLILMLLLVIAAFVGGIYLQSKYDIWTWCITFINACIEEATA